MKRYVKKMPSEGLKIVEFIQCQKSDEAAFFIYADLERLMNVEIILKIDSQHRRTYFIKFYNVYNIII